MAARGLMINPALYAGYKKTPWGAVERFLAYAMEYTIPYRLVQHHVAEMLTSVIPKAERTLMNESTPDIVALLDWLDDRFVLLRPGEEGFAEAVDVPRRIKRSGP
jgi:tRNA-dihydrouridine synthase 4